MVSRQAAKGFRWLAPVGAVAGLSGCSGPLSTLSAAGPSAQSIALLWWVMLIGGVAIFALVIGLLFLTLLRPGLASRIGPRFWIIGGGLVLPVSVLTVLVASALVQGETLLADRAGPAPARIEVQAAMWSWRFSYPDIAGGGSTTNVMHIPAGRPVELIVTSADVIHSFWIPRLGGKIDATPGHATILRISADRPGLYRGVCAEYCGRGHAGMWFHAEAHRAEDFEAAVTSAIREEAPGDGE